MYQPQVDDWKNFRELNWRMAFSLTPAGGQEAVGVATLHSNTEIDNDNKIVLLTDLKIVNTNFPSLDPQTAAKWLNWFRRFSRRASRFRCFA